MKAEIFEDDGFFYIELISTTADEASTLSRMAVSNKKRGVTIEAVFPRDKPIYCNIFVTKLSEDICTC